jgi:N-acetylglucosaminyldiphosphoundecaprenol N-acetyl-beta-D-mannosaminyltransferase
VGGLGARHDQAFVDAMDSANLVYADGASVVLAARAAGAKSIERAPTTDIGWALLRQLTTAGSEPPVVSVVGGPPGLADRALGTLVEAGIARAGVTDHGYHRNWDATIDRLRDHPSDVLVVGLGAPMEMIWVQQHLAQLSAGIVLTCGGWLGFLAGNETRAPEWLQHNGLEWVYRLAQSPRRLMGRYARGAVTTAALVAAALFGRWTRRDRNRPKD